MKSITAHAFSQVLEAEKDNKNIAFINVCTPGEYASMCIEGVENMPLSDLANRAHELKDKSTVYVHCASGARSQLAINQLMSLGVSAELINVEGGLMSWMRAGFQTVAGESRPSFLGKFFG